MEEQLGRHHGGGDAMAPLEPMLQRTLADIQERLTFRAQAFVREEIAGFVPKPADLDYPACLERQAGAELAAAPAAAESTEIEAVAADGEKDPLLEAAPATEAVAAAGPAEVVNGGSSSNGAGAGAATAEDQYRRWYPPVQRTLLLLSKLYRGVDARVFNGLAHEAVLAATASVQEAARQILKVGGQRCGASRRVDVCRFWCREGEFGGAVLSWAAAAVAARVTTCS